MGQELEISWDLCSACFGSTYTKFTKDFRIVHLKWVNVMLCELYLKVGLFLSYQTFRLFKLLNDVCIRRLARLPVTPPLRARRHSVKDEASVTLPLEAGNGTCCVTLTILSNSKKKKEKKMIMI